MNCDDELPLAPTGPSVSETFVEMTKQYKLQDSLVVDSDDRTPGALNFNDLLQTGGI